MLIRDKARLLKWLRENICSENRLIQLGGRAWIMTTWHPPHRGPDWMPRPQWDMIRSHLAQMGHKASRTEAIEAAAQWLAEVEVTGDGYTQERLF